MPEDLAAALDELEKAWGISYGFQKPPHGTQLESAIRNLLALWTRKKEEK